VLGVSGLTHKAATRVSQLSGGEKRRLDFATAIYGGPELVILDEPTTGLDIQSRDDLWAAVDKLRDEGSTVVLTTHYLEEAELHCNRIAMLKDGRIVALDTTRNLLESFSGLELRLRLDREQLPQPFPGELMSHENFLFVLKLEDYRQLEQALARLREGGVTILEMELQPPDLEDVFVRLTGRGT